MIYSNATGKIIPIVAKPVKKLISGLTHSSSACVPSAGVIRPPGQAVHTSAPTPAANSFNGQGVQRSAVPVAAANSPAGQSVHAPIPVPSSEKVPTGHSVQPTPSPAVENLPPSQSRHCAALIAATVLL